MTSKVIDTNVLLSLFTKRNKGQFEKAEVFFKKVESGKMEARISILVINEFIWLSAKFYNLASKDFIDWLLQLLSLKHIKIIEMDKDILVLILQKMLVNKIDFTDIYLWSIVKEKDIFSFDKDLRKLAVVVR